MFRVSCLLIFKYGHSDRINQAGYLQRWWNDKQGLFKLALMFSLPYAMLMWGYVLFLQYA